MRLIFVHGMSQEEKAADKLKADWQAALHNAWTARGLSIPDYDLDMPYYGDLLHELTEEIRGPGGLVIERGAGTASDFTDLESDILRALAKRAGAEDAAIRKELGQKIVKRGPENWEWTQGIARWLSREVPWLGKVSLPFVRQVDAYLGRPHITNAVDALVGPSFSHKPSVVVSHSLGTIISYKLLRQYASEATVKLYITLGSPLGIDVVKSHLKPPSLSVPSGVSRWVNGTDERDYVALHSSLDENTFASGIENITDIKNSRTDPHSILDYLSDKRINGLIRDALV